MADVTINGKEVTFDLSKITVREWREMHSPTFSDDGDDELMARVTGMDQAEITDLPMSEYKRLFDALVKKLRAPLADPN